MPKIHKIENSAKINQAINSDLGKQMMRKTWFNLINIYKNIFYKEKLY